jgi:hypothetical protein
MGSERTVFVEVMHLMVICVNDLLHPFGFIAPEVDDLALDVLFGLLRVEF